MTMFVAIILVSAVISWFACHRYPNKILVPILTILVPAIPILSILGFHNDHILLGYLVWAIGGGIAMGILAVVDRGPSHKAAPV